MRTILHKATWVSIMLMAGLMVLVNVWPRYGTSILHNAYAVRPGGWPLPIFDGIISSGNSREVVLRRYYGMWCGLRCKNCLDLGCLVFDATVFMVDFRTFSDLGA